MTSMADLPAFAKAMMKAGSSSIHGACICSIVGVRANKRTCRLGSYRFLPLAHPFRKKLLIPKCLDLHRKSPAPTFWTKEQIVEAGWNDLRLVSISSTDPPIGIAASRYEADKIKSRTLSARKSMKVYDRSSDLSHPYKKPGPGQYGIDNLTSGLNNGWDPSRQYKSDFMHHIGVGCWFWRLFADDNWCAVKNVVRTLAEALDCESSGSGLVFDYEARLSEKSLNRLSSVWERDAELPWALIPGSRKAISERIKNLLVPDSKRAEVFENCSS